MLTHARAAASSLCDLRVKQNVGDCGHPDYLTDENDSRECTGQYKSDYPAILVNVGGDKHQRVYNWVDKNIHKSVNLLITLLILGLNGAQGRNRTTDTRIFNPLLYP